MENPSSAQLSVTDRAESDPADTTSLLEQETPVSVVGVTKRPVAIHLRTRYCRFAVAAVVVVNVLVILAVLSENVTMGGHLQSKTSALFQAKPSPMPPKAIEASSTRQCVHLHSSHLETPYVPPDMCLSRSEIQQIIIDLVHTSAGHLAANNITYWLDSGTLLGSYREHTVIPHDVDADFGIDEASYLRIRDSMKLELPAPYIMTVFNSSIHDEGGRDANIPIRVIDTRFGLYVDVFVFLESVNHEDGTEMIGPIASVCFGGCRRCPRTKRGPHFLIPRAWVFPLNACNFADKAVQCPRQPDKYLDFLYGDNYMIPDQR